MGTQSVVGDDRRMRRHRRSLRLVALALVVALPLFGTSAVASAKAKSAKGCHKAHTCKSGGGAPTGIGAGGAPAPITVQIDPNPAIETGSSFVAVVVQVETSASFADDAVTISSTQLAASCAGQGLGFTSPSIQTATLTSATLTLDNDGNAQTSIIGENCAPGQSVVDASLAVAPYDTALGTLTVDAPIVTTPGVYGYPQTSGTATTGDVETGDFVLPGGTPGLESVILAVFEVETSPVYAEQTVEISSPELQDRCGDQWQFAPLDNALGQVSDGAGSTFLTTNTTATGILDDDGNALFFFTGASCAAGSSTVTADVIGGTHPTYTSTFNVLPPQVTI